jgi:hypothetical protein
MAGGSVMGIVVSWDNNDKTIIQVSFEDDGWNWEDFYDIDRQVQAMLAEVNHSVSYLADVKQLNLLPKGLSLLRARKVLHLRNPRSDITVIAGASPFIRRTVELIFKIYGGTNQRTFFVSTMADGRALIARRTAKEATDV